MKINIMWFRRDLRLEDNSALYHSLISNNPVLPIFIFDTNILDKLENKNDKRVEFIHYQLTKLHTQLKDYNSSIRIEYGNPFQIFKKLISEFEIENVYSNHDYEPYAIERDDKLKSYFDDNNINFYSYKDQVIFEKDEVVKDDGKPYTIFTPYSKKWKSKFNESFLNPFPTKNYFKNLFKTKVLEVPTLESLGFHKTGFAFNDAELNYDIVKSYTENRNYPAINGTSRLSVHLRFGTISIRKLVAEVSKLNETFLNELIWREFYMMILWHFPHVVKGAFKKQYDNILWRNNEHEFEAWCNGNTGFPIVDAGMRELNETGFMHNRVRMIVASFLIKDLLIDWRWGEAYFAQKLLDFELSSNNGGWQWAASSGCDAAPYFRIFNPTEQTKKFDPDFKYIKKWVPEFDSPNYINPIVDHKLARERTLQAYKNALNTI